MSVAGAFPALTPAPSPDPGARSDQNVPCLAPIEALYRWTASEDMPVRYSCRGSCRSNADGAAARCSHWQKTDKGSLDRKGRGRLLRYSVESCREGSAAAAVFVFVRPWYQSLCFMQQKHCERVRVKKSVQELSETDCERERARIKSLIEKATARFCTIPYIEKYSEMRLKSNNPKRIVEQDSLHTEVCSD